MTDAELDAQVDPIPGVGSTDDPHERLRRAEVEADGRPGDRALARLIRALHARATAGDGLPVAVGGVHRTALVRWDDDSTTWRGRDATGRDALVRVLRPHAARDPVLRRAFAREGRAVQALLTAAMPIEGAWPAWVLPLRGGRLPSADAPATAERAPVTRWLATGIAAMRAWNDAGLGLPALTPDELRCDEAGVSVACLTAVDPADDRTADALATLAAGLCAPDEDDPIAERILSLAEAPPATAAEAAHWVRAAFAEALAAQRHGLALRWRAAARSSRRHRLRDAMARLAAAVPPPAGTGAIGVDLDGGVTLLTSDGRSVWWGPADATARIWDGAEGLNAPLARRLLRARAESPANARLQATVGGDAEAVDRLGRWLAAAVLLHDLRHALQP